LQPPVPETEERTGLFTEGVATGTIHANSDGTLYDTVGDIFVLAVLAWVGALFAWQSVTGLWAG